jgi:hypothetical protein
MRVSFFAVCFYGRGGAVNILAAAHSARAHTHTLREKDTERERERDAIHTYTHTRAIIPQIKGNGLHQRPNLPHGGRNFG